MLDSISHLLAYNPDEPLIFSSGLFLFLFLGFSFVYMLLQRQRVLRLLFVTAFSYYFYYKSSGVYFVLLAIVTVSDYFIQPEYGTTGSATPSAGCCQRCWLR